MDTKITTKVLDDRVAIVVINGSKTITIVLEIEQARELIRLIQNSINTIWLGELTEQ